MNKRYRVEAQQPYGVTVFALLDYCVDVGNQPITIGIFASVDEAMSKANNLNSKDGEAAHEAWEALKTAPVESFDKAEPRVPTHFRCNGKMYVLYGSPEAMAAYNQLRHARFKRNVDLQRINSNLRSNLRDSEEAVCKLKGQLEMAQAAKAEAERLRGAFDGRKFTVYLDDGPTAETGPQLANRVQALIADLHGWQRKHNQSQDTIEALKKQRDSHVCNTAPASPYNADDVTVLRAFARHITRVVGEGE